MKPRFSRLVAVAGSLVALVAGSTPPPARAFTVSSVELIAAVTVIGGIGYPVTTLPTPLGLVPIDCLPLQTGPDNCHPVYDHPRRVLAASIVCVSEQWNVDKAAKGFFHSGPCAFTSVNTTKPDPPENVITGHCDLNGGQLTLLFTDPLGQDYLLDLHFTTAGLMFIEGHWFKLGPGTTGQHGLVFGLGDDIPPTPLETPDQSCFIKSAEDFVIPATLTFLTDPTL